MTIATSPTTRRRVHESTTFATTNSRIDEVNHVIRGVKIIGLQSRNAARVLGLPRAKYGAALDRPYSYSMAALRAALPLYEGAPVYSNHTEFGFDKSGARTMSPGDRNNNDLVGWLENVRAVEGQGLFGDLNYLAEHPISRRLVEVAKRRPSVLALSHEGDFSAPALINGQVVVTDITHIDSVAIVRAPAGTTNSLFESHHHKEKTVTLTEELTELEAVKEKYQQSGCFAESLRRPAPRTPVVTTRAIESHQVDPLQQQQEQQRLNEVIEQGLSLRGRPFSTMPAISISSLGRFLG